MASSIEQMAAYAQYLRNAAPQEFDRFRTAFGLYSADAVTNLLNATTNLPQVQGHAQQCHKLFQMLQEIK